jgi:hypothetical protein
MDCAPRRGGGGIALGREPFSQKPPSCGADMARTKLAKYQEMRDFSQTAEPSGQDAKVAPSQALRFVIQKARRQPSAF